MKKFILTISTTVLFVLYIFYERVNTPQSVNIIPAANTASVNLDSAGTSLSSGSAPPAQPAAVATQPAPKSTAAAPTPAVKSAPAPAPAPVKIAGAYKDGTYTGNGADAYYGTVQVQAIIQNGKIADVKFLSYPIDRHTSQQISSMATPILAAEAISAQSANVKIVSGATDTSQASQQSLASALIQAKN